MQKINIAKVVLDFDLYPRASVDSYHVNSIVEAILAGVEMPPIIIDKKSYRVVDGFHRIKAYQKVNGAGAKISAILKDYKTEKELFTDAAKYNSAHGRMMTIHDKTHCIIRADELGIKFDVIAKALNITMDKLGELRGERIAERAEVEHQGPTIKRAKKGKKGSFGSVPIKGTIKHLAGKRITKKQIEANEKLCGKDQMFIINQVLILLKTDGFLNTENENVMAGLKEVCELLQKFI